MKKRYLSTEVCYVLGIAILAVGTALMEKADMGMSMVVAPAYLIHLKLRGVLPFFTFGMAEYTLQALLLAVMCALLKRFRPVYLFSFATAVLYGFALDGAIALFSFLPAGTIALRLVFYTAGMLLGSVAISLFFHTYLAPEAYELFVRELSARFGVNIHRFKTAYDVASLAVSVILSFCFFGFGVFKGVGVGTIVCAFLNGFLISRVTRFLDARFEFRDALPWRRYFEGR